MLVAVPMFVAMIVDTITHTIDMYILATHTRIAMQVATNVIMHVTMLMYVRQCMLP